MNTAFLDCVWIMRLGFHMIGQASLICPLDVHRDWDFLLFTKAEVISTRLSRNSRALTEYVMESCSSQCVENCYPDEPGACVDNGIEGCTHSSSSSGMLHCRPRQISIKDVEGPTTKHTRRRLG